MKSVLAGILYNRNLFSFVKLITSKLRKEDSLMAKKRKGTSSEKLSEVIVKGMQEKKAMDIVVMDLRKVKNAVADFFVICSGNSDKQLDAIADSVDQEVFKAFKENPWHTEGKNNKEWMLLDYIDVVAHVFRKDRREFYALERLWGDADIMEIEDAH
jgi:ribosome-associated protein